MFLFFQYIFIHSYCRITEYSSNVKNCFTMFDNLVTDEHDCLMFLLIQSNILRKKRTFCICKETLFCVIDPPLKIQFKKN